MLPDYQKACELIALGVPKFDEWDSAADFIEYVAYVLDLHGIDRPDYYQQTDEQENHARSI